MKPPYPSLTPTWHNTTYPAISPTNPSLSFSQKTVVVTGGGRGLGPEIARAFAAAGAAHVALIGRTQSTLSETAERIKAEFTSVEVSTHVGDVGDEAAMRKAAEGVRKWDVLVLNAGVLSPDPQLLGTVKVADWWGIFETNVKGALTTTQAFLPTRNPSASIVGINANMISLSATHPMAHGSSAYVCSKIAQMKLLEYVAAEEAADLFVVSVHPGVLMTDMVKDWSLGANLNESMLDDLSLPAHFLVWVVSEEARFLKGRYVCANWDVGELKGKAETIEGERILENGILGWPYGEAMDAMLAQGASGVK